MGLRILFIVFAMLIITSCSEEPITIEQLRKLESNSKEALNSSFKASNTAFKSVSNHFTQLSEYLNKSQLSDKDLKRMESMLVDLNKKRNEFSTNLVDAESSGKNLIKLLNRRASENSEKTMKKEMTLLISTRKKAFDKVISNTKDQLTELDNAIQRFDNIVGFLQVTAGLQGIDSITNQVTELKKSIERLEVLVVTYTSESRELMKHYE